MSTGANSLEFHVHKFMSCHKNIAITEENKHRAVSLTKKGSPWNSSYSFLYLSSRSVNKPWTDLEFVIQSEIIKRKINIVY